MIKIPPSTLVNTGEQHSMQPVIDDFLNQVYETIMANLNLERGQGKHPYFKVKSGELAFNNFTITDNYISYLMYRERCVALVAKTRTGLNHVRYDFFLNLEGILDEE